jgi:hypothetical protein
MIAYRRKMAGYSSTPLAQKLGIKPASRVVVAGAPPGFTATLGKLPEGSSLGDAAASRGAFDVAVLFTTELADLVKRLPALQKRMDPAAGLWVAWPKRASGKKTDLTEDVVRKVALERALVDNKVCAIDDTWSGLRLVIRVADRAKLSAPRSRAPRPAADAAARDVPTGKSPARSRARAARR